MAVVISAIAAIISAVSVALMPSGTAAIIPDPTTPATAAVLVTPVEAMAEEEEEVVTAVVVAAAINSRASASGV
jgi:hypothetical protein